MWSNSLESLLNDNDNNDTTSSFVTSSITSKSSSCDSSNKDVDTCTNIMGTLYQRRLHLAKTYNINELTSMIGVKDESGIMSECSLTELEQSLIGDTLAICQYREKCDKINSITFDRWFNTQKYGEMTKMVSYRWLNTNRDFIYTSPGMKILAQRYLQKNEPIQYAMLRFALVLCNNNCSRHIVKTTYDLISTGMMHISSILAYDQQDSGEACRLYIIKSGYDAEVVRQINEIERTVCLGVGVGIGAHVLPLHGKQELGKIKTGFRMLMEKLDSCRNMTIHERTPKISVYLPIYNDTVLIALNLKQPHTGIKNIFPALMINNYFMECVQNNDMWYLFSGELLLDGESLHDTKNEKEFKQLYQRFVDLKLYTRSIKARDLMDQIVESYRTSSGVYIIFSDTVNQFQNTKFLGNVKTLNLCAEITNYTNSDESSSCSLISVNFAAYNSFEHIQQAVLHYILTTFECDIKRYCSIPNCKISENVIEYAVMMGFMASIVLNTRIGSRENREIGISPLGMYDIAVLLNLDPVYVCEILSEMLYKGAILGSCYYYKKYFVLCKRFVGSEFSYGRPQWMLRDVKPQSDWSIVCGLMKQGMANSALTAQAPTATTSLLTGASESVLLPMDTTFVRCSENGRNRCICYGHACHKLQNPNYNMNKSAAFVPRKKVLLKQIDMYRVSAPFIDQSQSTIFYVHADRQEIFDTIAQTFDAQLKTGIYYLQVYQNNETLNIIRRRESVVGNTSATDEQSKAIITKPIKRSTPVFALTDIIVDNSEDVVDTPIINKSKCTEGLLDSDDNSVESPIICRRDVDCFSCQA